jgi:heat shock protein HspQ
MSAVRGKFAVTKVTNHSATSTRVEIDMEPRYSNTPEDNSYSAATPQGHISMVITNRDAVKKLPIGGVFYVDFTPVPEPTK